MGRTNEREKVDVSRTICGGRPILMAENTLGYTITGPAGMWGGSKRDIVKMHDLLAPVLAEVIQEMIGTGCKIFLGNTSSIRIEDKPIAGHSAAIMDNSFLYQGAIIVAPWDIQLIEELLELKEGNRERISALPSVASLALDKRDKAVHKHEIVQKFMSKLPSQSLKEPTESERAQVIAKAEELKKEKYANKDWIWNDDNKLRRGADFCILFEDRSAQTKPTKAFDKIPAETLEMLGRHKIVFFGYDVFDAATNLALNEALLNYSETTGNVAIRFYDFEKPSIMLARYDHPDVIKKDIKHLLK